jgi:hypothetical protein
MGVTSGVAVEVNVGVRVGVALSTVGVNVATGVDVASSAAGAASVVAGAGAVRPGGRTVGVGVRVGTPDGSVAAAGRAGTVAMAVGPGVGVSGGFPPRIAKAPAAATARITRARPAQRAQSGMRRPFLAPGRSIATAVTLSCAPALRAACTSAVAACGAGKRRTFSAM